MIDIVVISHTSEIDIPINPHAVFTAIADGAPIVPGAPVRSVTVLNANTGLTATFRDDEVVAGRARRRKRRPTNG